MSVISRTLCNMLLAETAGIARQPEGGKIIVQEEDKRRRGRGRWRKNLLAADDGSEGGLSGERAEGVARPIEDGYSLGCSGLGRGLWGRGGGEAVAPRDGEGDIRGRGRRRRGL